MGRRTNNHISMSLAPRTKATAFALLLASSSLGQEIKVAKASLLMGNRTAVTDPRLDINGDTCALLIIDAGELQGLQFPNKDQYTESLVRDGKYHVYMPAMLNKLTYGHESYQRGEINLKELGFKRLKAGKTYSVKLEVPKAGSAALQSKAIVKVSPANAQLFIDGQGQRPSTDGTYQIDVAAGTHQYKATLADYKDDAGSFTVTDADAKAIAVTLRPKTMKVKVACNVKSASVFVDDVFYGRPGKLTLPQGRHTLRLHADGYIDKEQTFTIYPETLKEAVAFDLAKNKNQVDIHAVAVTIYSKGNAVYKNNKKIPEWRHGQPIKMMPGKYLISDDINNEQEIEVTAGKPLKVYLGASQRP